MTIPEDKKKANKRGNAWKKKNMRRYSLALNIKNDAKEIEKLESVESVNGYLKSLITQDISK